MNPEQAVATWRNSNKLWLKFNQPCNSAHQAFLLTSHRCNLWLVQTWLDTCSYINYHRIFFCEKVIFRVYSAWNTWLRGICACSSQFVSTLQHLKVVNNFMSDSYVIAHTDSTEDRNLKIFLGKYFYFLNFKTCIDSFLSYVSTVWYPHKLNICMAYS